MEKLMEAIKSGDLVEAKREFNAKMELVKESVYAREKIEVARSVITEGEEKKDDDDEDEDDEDEDEEEEK
ncbi:hypothetical protein OFDDKENP_00263 [Aeromonas phage B614]|nr:hypothetical protein OFDDKENP_00263 [Aeromonas phage B614]UYD58260.1 hypothetical protein JNEOFJEA_00181 [Aeromonas phage UP87]UYD58374.1 hypothetical protein IPAKJDPM_00031 [Aeromonas phage avDM14-QBC]UYD58838.1 hypothetical protein HNNIDBEH_00262 [Aeromonas phage avDM10-HWA]UYD59107.1 hypothetical protein OFOPOMKI_00257 [Aeromonas phage avDM7-IJDJ]UYD59919.1 hypothetical protein LEHPIFIF_00146 [Aeromonas phage avDM9-HANS]